MGEILIPPAQKKVQGQIVFLAGPIQGVFDWQKEAIKHFQEKAPHIHIACPRRPVWNDKDETFNFDEQVDWETQHLNLAAKNGCILFWLANEGEHHCKRCYAQTTRFELAEWKIKHEREKVKLVVGIDTDFSGSRYIKRRLKQDCPKVPVCTSLIETCDEVIRLLQKN